MQLFKSLAVRIFLASALLFGPVMHASAMCEMSVTDTHVDLHTSHHTDASHHHGTPSQHHSDDCCDTVCVMACTAMLTPDTALQQPVAVDSRTFAETTDFRFGSSHRPDPHPPKTLI